MAGRDGRARSSGCATTADERNDASTALRLVGRSGRRRGLRRVLRLASNGCCTRRRHGKARKRKPRAFGSAVHELSARESAQCTTDIRLLATDANEDVLDGCRRTATSQTEQGAEDGDFVAHGGIMFSTERTTNFVQSIFSLCFPVGRSIGKISKRSHRFERSVQPVQETAGKFAYIAPSSWSRKESSSASSSASFVTGLPAPCPAFVSMRIRIGRVGSF